MRDTLGFLKKSEEEKKKKEEQKKNKGIGIGSTYKALNEVINSLNGYEEGFKYNYG